jgi:hypothetical protein
MTLISDLAARSGEILAALEVHEIRFEMTVADKPGGLRAAETTIELRVMQGDEESWDEVCASARSFEANSHTDQDLAGWIGEMSASCNGFSFDVRYGFDVVEQTRVYRRVNGAAGAIFEIRVMAPEFI